MVKMLKMMFRCIRIVWKERRNMPCRAKRRRIAKQLQGVS